MPTLLNNTLNPTDEERHEILMEALEQRKRSEDYDYIIEDLSPPLDITHFAKPGKLKGIKIGIIGAGLAGLAAAFELRKSGADITILEASDNRIGGRVYTHYFDSKRNYYGEFGAARVPISHETTWHYINLFRLNTIPLTSSNSAFLYVHNTRLRATDSIEKCLYPLYELTRRERSTSWNDLSRYAMNHAFLSLTPTIRSELIKILPTYSPEILNLMNISIRENFEKLELSQGAIQLLSDTKPVVSSFLHHSYDELAAIEYTLDNLMIYTIMGGLCLLPYALYDSLLTEYPAVYQHMHKSDLGNVNIKQGKHVTGIYHSNYRNKIIISYNNNMDTTESADVFDYCICTIPFSALRTVDVKPSFSNTKMQAIKELNYTDAQKTLYLCNHRFWERDTDYGRIYGGSSLTSLPIQTIVYPRKNLINGVSMVDEPGVLVASYGLGQDATRVGGLHDFNRYSLITRSVEEVHGLPRGFLNTLIEGSSSLHWGNESNFLGAFANSLPRQKPLFLYEMQRPEYNNRLFFAGEHISSKHGWMQGALYSGKFAANALAKSYMKSLG